MAKNKITYERDWDNKRYGCTVHYFTGSLRQPTIVEANNYINEHRLEIYGIMVFAQGSMFGEEWLPPEENTTLRMFEYDAQNGDHCPICGHEHDLGGERCPVCNKRWDSGMDTQ